MCDVFTLINGTVGCYIVNQTQVKRFSDHMLMRDVSDVWGDLLDICYQVLEFILAAENVNDAKENLTRVKSDSMCILVWACRKYHNTCGMAKCFTILLR